MGMTFSALVLRFGWFTLTEEKGPLKQAFTIYHYRRSQDAFCNQNKCQIIGHHPKFLSNYILLTKILTAKQKQEVSFSVSGLDFGQLSLCTLIL